nr:helix-turn-helix domain-containing protein [Sphingobium sp. D43FB]
MLCSIGEAASALSVGRTFTYGLIKSGRLETVKLGRRTLVKVDSIKVLIDSAKGGAQ